MSKKFYIKSFYVFVLVTMMISCGEKDILTSTDFDLSESNLTSEMLENAKSYFVEKTQTSNLKVSEGSTNTKKLEPVWSKAKKVLLENGDNIVFVPVEDYKINSNKVRLFRCFIFKEQNEKIVDGRIVEFVGDIDYIVRNGEMIIKKFGKSQIDKFNGVVSSYDLNYNYLDGYFFVKGKKQNATARLYASTSKTSTDNPNGRVASTLRTQTEGGCSDFYLVTTYDDGSQSWSWLFGTCGGGAVPTTPPGGISELLPGSAGGIKNQLVRPCFIAALNTLLNSNFNNKIQNILQNFNKSSTLNFTITEGPMASTRAALTVGNVITLNTTILQNSTEAFVAATIYHEVLHVFMGNTTATADHNAIANGYIEPLKQAMEYTYNLNSTDATALAWTGLGNTTAWNDRTKLTVTQTNAMIDIQTAYQNYGNDCH